MRQISVILPVYNGIEYLQQSVESVLKQSFDDFDFLVIDDCSSDGSWEYLSSIEDLRLKLFRNEKNRGLFYNLNYLIRQSNTPLIKLWAQDDVMYANCIEEIILFHAKYPGISFSYSDREIIDDQGNIIQKPGKDDTPEYISPFLHTKIMLYTGSIAGNIANVCLNKKLMDEQSIGYFNEEMRYSGDLDMWERLTRDNYIGRIPLKLIQLRNHVKQLSRQNHMAVKQLKENIDIFSRLDKRLPKELLKYKSINYKWRRNVYHTSVYLNFLKAGQFALGKEYFNELKKIDHPLSLFYHWFISKIMNRLGIRIAKLDLTDRPGKLESHDAVSQQKNETVNEINEINPLVSVLTTAYNRENFIRVAIESVLKSTYSNFELIVVDDHSADRTFEIAKSYELNDSRVKVFRNETNLGDYPNRRKAVSLALGKYIKFVDSDDFIYPRTLEIMVNSMLKFPEAAMGIVQRADMKDGSGYPQVSSPEMTYKQHFFGKGVLSYGPSATIIRRDVYNELGGFNYKRYISDTEFWLKLAALYPIVKLQPNLFYWRIHPGQEYFFGSDSYSYLELAYPVYMNSLLSAECPLKKDDIALVIRRLKWKHARDILSLAFKKTHLVRAFRIYKQSDLNMKQLFEGILPYSFMKRYF